MGNVNQKENGPKIVHIKNAKTHKSPLVLDVSRDLRTIDSFTQRVISEPGLVERFLRNPAQVCIDLGLHPPTTDSAIARTNRIFYATLTNRALIKYLLRTVPKLKIPERLKKTVKQNLSRGILQAPIELDLLYIEHYWDDDKKLRRILELHLSDLNRRGILTRRFKPAEIRRYIDSVTKFNKTRGPLKDMPQLDYFGPGYGIGVRPAEATKETARQEAQTNVGQGLGLEADVTEIGVMPPGVYSHGHSHASTNSEVGPNATVVAIAEIALAVTVAIPVYVLGSTESPEELALTATRALQSNKSSMRSTILLTNLLAFCARLSLFLNNLQRETYYGKPKAGTA